MAQLTYEDVSIKHSWMVNTNCYRPQHSCDKVMFLHMSVILFTGGRVSARPPPLGQTPPGRHPLPPQTATAADGTHRTGMHSYLIWFQAQNQHRSHNRLIKLIVTDKITSR